MKIHRHLQNYGQRYFNTDEEKKKLSEIGKHGWNFNLWDSVHFSVCIISKNSNMLELYHKWEEAQNEV